MMRKNPSENKGAARRHYRNDEVYYTNLAIVPLDGQLKRDVMEPVGVFGY